MGPNIYFDRDYKVSLTWRKQSSKVQNVGEVLKDDDIEWNMQVVHQ